MNGFKDLPNAVGKKFCVTSYFAVDPKDGEILSTFRRNKRDKIGVYECLEVHEENLLIFADEVGDKFSQWAFLCEELCENSELHEVSTTVPSSLDGGTRMKRV